MAAWRDDRVIAENSDESLEDDFDVCEWPDDLECSSKDETSNNARSELELTDLYKEMAVERKKMFQRIFDKYENPKNQHCEDIHPHTFKIRDRKTGSWRKLEEKDLKAKPLVISEKNCNIIKKIAKESGMLNHKDTGNERSFVIPDAGVSHCAPQESISVRDESKGAEEPLTMTLTNSLIFKSKSSRLQSLRSFPREASSASGEGSRTQSTAGSGLLGKIGTLSSSQRQLGNSAQSRSETNMSRSALLLPTLHGKLRGGKSEEYAPTDDSAEDHNDTPSRKPEISGGTDSFICPLSSSPFVPSYKNEHDDIEIHHVRRKKRRVAANKLSNLKEPKSIGPNKLSPQKFAHRLESVDNPRRNPNVHKNGVSGADYYKDYDIDVFIKPKKIGISSLANPTNHGGVSMTGKATPENTSLNRSLLRKENFFIQANSRVLECGGADSCKASKLGEAVVDAITLTCNFGNVYNSTPGEKDNRRSVDWEKIKKKIKKQSRSTFLT